MHVERAPSELSLLNTDETSILEVSNLLFQPSPT